MDETFFFLKDRKYIKNNRIKSIKLFEKPVNKPNFPNEICMFQFDFNLNGTPKLILQFDIEGKVSDKFEYNKNGQRILTTIDKSSTNYFRVPIIATISYKYADNLLILERKTIENNYAYGKYEKYEEYYEEYKYDSKKRLIEIIKNDLVNKTTRKTIYEYPSLNSKKEIDYMSNGKINEVIISNYDNYGRLIEKIAYNSDQYKMPKTNHIMYRIENIYTGNLKTKVNIFDHKNKLKSFEKHFYDKNGVLNKSDSYEDNRLVSIYRFEYRYLNFLNIVKSLF